MMNHNGVELVRLFGWIIMVDLMRLNNIDDLFGCWILMVSFEWFNWLLKYWWWIIMAYLMRLFGWIIFMVKLVVELNGLFEWRILVVDLMRFIWWPRLMRLNDLFEWLIIMIDFIWWLRLMRLNWMVWNKNNRIFLYL